jgi:hypothetical protein
MWRASLVDDVIRLKAAGTRQVSRVFARMTARTKHELLRKSSMVHSVDS